MIEAGRRGEGASPPKPITRFETLMPGKKITLRKWERREVVAGWEGLGNEPTQAEARLGEIITRKE